MKNILIIITVLLIFGIIATISSSVFVVDEKAQCIVLQFGRYVKTVQEPGLNFKVPFIQSVVYYDDRILEYNSSPTEILTKDKKNLLLDNFARWRIEDPTKFYESVKTEISAQARLDDIIYSMLRVELGRYSLEEIISSQRDTIMRAVTEKSASKAKDYGIEIKDVRIKRADLPPENEKSIFERMKAEREKMAKTYRSEGDEEATKIRAQTDKDKTIILSQAYEKSQIIKGEGDADAIKIYANAYQNDPEFYTFFRSLEAYKKTMDENTTIVLSPDVEFFKYLKETK
ncbi:protease modulator HflC [bacterium]|nr:protease modulator HflC [bacterium]